MKIETGTERMKKAVRMAITTLVVGSVASIATALPVAADGPQSAGEKASPSGQTHGAFAPRNGGDFGWLGEMGGTPGYHDAVGQEPGATGYNNSAGAPWGDQNK